VKNIINYAKSKFDSNISILFSESLNKIRSGVRQDLRTLHGKLVFHKHSRKHLTLNERLELVIYQLASYYLHPQRAKDSKDFFREDKQYHYIKFILESLRAYFSLQNYYEVYHHRSSYKILEPKQIENLIKYRELFGVYDIDHVQLNLANFIEVVVLSLFSSDGSDDLLKKLKKLSKTDNIINLFTVSIIIFVLLSEGKLKNSAFNILEESLRKTIGETVDLNNSEIKSNENLKIMKLARKKFIQALMYKNLKGGFK